jgi:hypothetical protein
MFKQTLYKKSKHSLLSITFFPKTVADYEIKVEKYGGARQAIDGMRFA